MSERSSNTQVTVNDYNLHDSCVLRNFPQLKSTHLRFLAWVQYTRQFPDHSITDDERRTCPLLWCRAIFRDQDSMLKHVWECEHLSKGLYWCFQCQKPERVGKFECRRCQGRSSRTERIASVAKKMFSALGSRRAVERSPVVEESTLSKISEASKVCAWRSQQQSSMSSYLDPPSIPELPDSYLSEMDDTCVAELSSSFECAPAAEFEFPRNSSPRPTHSILPRLNTTNFEMPLESSLTANFVSPLSPDGGLFHAFEISPTDSEASGNTLFTDSAYSSATFESSWNGSIWDLDFTRREEPVKSVTSEKAWHPFEVPSATNSPVVHSASRCDRPKAKLSEHWTDAQSLINSLREVLDEHLSHSRSSLQQMASNSIIDELLSLSSESIVSMGFTALTGLLEGRRPTSIVPLFAFTHIAYAAAIAIDHGSSSVQSMEWFEDSLLLLESLSERQRRTYTQIVRVIWQPRACISNDQLGPKVEHDTKPVSDRDYKAEHKNRLVRACEHFLDVQEGLAYGCKLPKFPVSQFDFVQAAFAQEVKNHRIVDELIKKSSIEAFIEDVVEVEKRLDKGLIRESRQLELELICAGKVASQSDAAFIRFSDHITRLFDPLRTDRSRTSHHLDSIATAQQILSQTEPYREEPGEQEVQFELDADLLNPADSGYSTLDPSSSGKLQFQDIDGGILMNEAYKLTPRHPPSAPPRRHPTPIDHRSQIPMTSSPPPPPPPTPPPKSLPTSSSRPPVPIPIPKPSISAPAGNKYRCHCGYEPSGSEDWKASNFARHRRTQHASPAAAKTYRCSFPGCPAKYRRSDNLRAHFRAKGHGDGEGFAG